MAHRASCRRPNLLQADLCEENNNRIVVFRTRQQILDGFDCRVSYYNPCDLRGKNTVLTRMSQRPFARNTCTVKSVSLKGFSGNIALNCKVVQCSAWISTMVTASMMGTPMPRLEG